MKIALIIIGVILAPFIFYLGAALVGTRSVLNVLEAREIKEKIDG